MRSAIIGVGCLALGAIAALGYSHYLGEGKQLADLQNRVATLQSGLDSAKNTSKLAKSENDALAAQVQQLIATKDQLQKQVSGQGSSAPAFPGLPNMNRADMAGIVKAQMSHMYDQRLQMLISRLHLTPDQIAQIKAAMDAEGKRTEETTEKMLSGQKVNFQDMVKNAQNVKSVEQTIQDLLTPDQKTAYKQLQNDQKTSQAESSASMEMNQVAPLLQLNDTQKDQVESALYQVQLDSGNPNWVKKYGGSTPGDPLAYMDAQEKAKEDALSSILTPDQMTTYKQQAESQLSMQRTMMQKFMPAGGFSAAVSGGATTTAPAAPGSPVPASSASASSGQNSPANP